KRESAITQTPVVYVDASEGAGALSYDKLVENHSNLTIREQPSHGTLRLTHEGIVYTPNPDFLGVDHVRYGVTQTSLYTITPFPGANPVIQRVRYTQFGDIYFVVNGAGPSAQHSFYQTRTNQDLSVAAVAGLLSTVVRYGHPVVVDSVSQPQHGRI